MDCGYYNTTLQNYKIISHFISFVACGETRSKIHLASSSDSERSIRFILPARETSHVIRQNIESARDHDRQNFTGGLLLQVLHYEQPNF